MIIECINFVSAEHFVSYLRPSDPRWWNAKSGRRTHLFRGHANASWSLLPKGWRPLGSDLSVMTLMTNIMSHFGIADDRPLEAIDANLWRLTLAEAAIQFAHLGREIGLEIPWSVPPSVFDQSPDHVPYIDPALLALAQHHGVPTQLLDWSFDPLTAAYFAASESFTEDDLCVWTLEIGKIGVGDQNGPALSISPTSGNANLRAQSGCFLSYAQGPDLERIYQNNSNRWPSFESADNLRSALKKLVLRGSERRKLADLLLREGRSKAHLMPSWDNVASTLLNSWRYPGFR